MAALLRLKQSGSWILALGWVLLLLVGCGPRPTAEIPPTPTFLTSTPQEPTLTSTPTPTVTLRPPSTSTPLPPTAEGPLILLFYGDSVLKVGDVDQAPSEGFSFVDPLKASLPPDDIVIISNHGGLRAKWAYENLQQYVLRLHPDLVTLWWGMNDLGGCPGVFDRQTNTLLPNRLNAQINEHIYYLRLQIDALLEQKTTVFVMTPIPVMGQLPWSHFTPDYQLVWEPDYHCDFNPALEKLVLAQRTLVADYGSKNKPVYLVDAWQVYKDNPNADKMYMDVVHPASHGVELIAAEWLRVFGSMKR